MASKTPTDAQAKAMKEHGIEFPFLWAVLQDLPNSLIVKNRIDGQVRLIEKHGCPL